MARPLKHSSGPPAMELVEEATALLRQAPATTWAAYLIGAIPFVLGFLFYWADMSRSPAAAGHLLEASLGVTMLYVWMCCWQSVFILALAAQREGQAPAPWTLARIRSLIVTQTTWQPSALLLLPVAVIIAVPFGWVYAFYQNLSATEGHPREAARRAREQAARWPGQNHVVLAALSLLAFFVFLNLLILVLLWPTLVRMFTGVESVGDSVANRLNTTTIAAVSLLTYLCVDPLAKACYVLRCFYGESRRSGADLRAALARLARVAIIALLLFTPGTTTAQQSPAPAVSPQELDRSIDRVIHRREFAWRMPRERQSEQAQNEVGNFFARIGRAVFRGIARGAGAAGRWIRELLESLDWNPSSSAPTGVAPARQLQRLLYVLSVILAGVLVALWWRLRGRRKPAIVTATAAQPAIDLRAEDVAADQLPESGWLALAQEWIDKSDLRMAIRALYLASLAHLAHRELIAIHPAKSNADYAAELRRRARAVREISQTFQQNLRVFERSWYGDHEVTPDALAQFRSNFDRLRNYAFA